MGVPEDIALLERNIDTLKHEYEQFFQGVNKIPPHTIQTAVERLIRKYVGGGINNAALRFRYKNDVARYNTLKELWARRMRMLEEGINIGGPQRNYRRSTPPPTPPPPPPPKQQPVEEAAKTAASRGQSTPKGNKVVDSLYKQFIAAHEKSGSSAKKVSPQNFEKLIAKQVATIKKAYNCSSVTFRIQVEDGEVKLKAKPVK